MKPNTSNNKLEKECNVQKENDMLRGMIKREKKDA